MKIGNFQDFLATVTPEIVEQITADAGEKAAQTRDNMSPTAPEFFGNQIAAVSLTFALELLGLYHKWLEQQL